jgi:hypothetical protein
MVDILIPNERRWRCSRDQSILVGAETLKSSAWVPGVTLGSKACGLEEDSARHLIGTK